jgi:hypothetical protein
MSLLMVRASLYKAARIAKSILSNERLCFLHHESIIGRGNKGLEWLLG